jgi:hypothetical protein
MADLHRENPEKREKRENRENHENPENPENLVNPGVSHETSDVNIRAILAFGAALFAVAVAVHVLIYGMFGYFDSREGIQAPAEYPLAASQGHREPPEPRLQTDPRQDLADMRAKEDEQLQSYGWVDKNAGVVRIPIDAAMKLTLERGLPARSEPTR